MSNEVNNVNLELLGMEVVDAVTNFKGVVSSISYDLYGCIQAVVSPYVNEKGEVGSGKWFDTIRLKETGPSRAMTLPVFADYAVDRETKISPVELLGLRVEDSVSRLKGVVSHVSYDLPGCILVCVYPPVNCDGSLSSEKWVDIGRIKITDHEPVMAQPDFAKIKGCVDKPDFCN